MFSIRSRPRPAQKSIAVAVLAAASLTAVSAYGQTVHVDTSHAVNHFVPNQTLGAGIDRIATGAIEHDLIQPNLDATLEAGWQPVSYRQNTDLVIEAWHWNPAGTWSDPADGGKGYFTGSTNLGEPIKLSYGWELPHRGFTRNDGTGNNGFSRLTDGDTSTYWKSNPYLTEKFTGESDTRHPQWVVIDLTQPTPIDSIRIDWAAPYAKHYLVQYWVADAGISPIASPTRGEWKTYYQGSILNGAGGNVTLKLALTPSIVQFLRIWMTESSDTCDTHGSSDPRNCVGYAINEVYVGTTTKDGAFHDVLRHTPDQEQAVTFCSSVDPWHAAGDEGTTLQAQVGFDLFYTSGITRGLPAMIPVAMLYDTPDNAVAEISYIEKRKYPISYVEMGEESDGQNMMPEDYAALYVQWAKALHKLDPSLKLGGPSFQGVNEDIQVWPDAAGQTSWVRRFLSYLKAHDAMDQLSFFSFEHYPNTGCTSPWQRLYDEPDVVSHIMDIWHKDGIPADMPMFITETNLSPAASETYMDIFSGLWLADFIGKFIESGGKGVYYFHYLPIQMEHGCNDSQGTFGMFTVNEDYQIQQRLAQFYVAHMINRDWVIPGAKTHDVFAATSDIEDGADHTMVNAYAVSRPDGTWSVMLVNRDQETPHKVKVVFDGAGSGAAAFAGTVNVSTFGREQYQWHPSKTHFMAHAAAAGDPSVMANGPGHADPDGPAKVYNLMATQDTAFDLPASSVTVISGKISGEK
jgi:F5/8 type C domain/Glycosyl hydrolases family 39